jgi:hypothetical protein
VRSRSKVSGTGPASGPPATATARSSAVSRDRGTDLPEVPAGPVVPTMPSTVSAREAAHPSGAAGWRPDLTPAGSPCTREVNRSTRPPVVVCRSIARRGRGAAPVAVSTTVPTSSTLSGGTTTSTSPRSRPAGTAPAAASGSATVPTTMSREARSRRAVSPCSRARASAVARWRSSTSSSVSPDSPPAGRSGSGRAPGTRRVCTTVHVGEPVATSCRTPAAPPPERSRSTTTRPQPAATVSRWARISLTCGWWRRGEVPRWATDTRTVYRDRRGPPAISRPAT